MSAFRADLHCHTNCSDGSDTPERVIELAKEVGLQGLSITDHDTVAAYTDALFQQAADSNLLLLPGIELSTEWQGISVHILGYRIDVRSLSLATFLNELQERRNARNRKILENLTKKNMPISEEELIAFSARIEGKKTIGRPHIAALMVEKGYVATWQQAFDAYLKEGGSCYVSGVKYTPKEAIEQIHLAGGKAVLAHPHFLRKGHFLRDLLTFPFDGIECYYGRLTKDQEHRWVEIAKKKEWIATGGSDYHGTFKPNLSLGCSWVNEETFSKLY